MKQVFYPLESELLEYTGDDEIIILQLIRWMYTGNLHLHEQTFYPIMKLAKKLQIQQIVQKCKKLMQENIPLASLPLHDNTGNTGGEKSFVSVETQYDQQVVDIDMDTESTGSNEEETRNEVRLIMEHHHPDIGQPVPVPVSINTGTSSSENEQSVNSGDPSDQVSSTTQVSSTSGTNQIQVQVAPIIQGESRSTLPCPAACPRTDGLLLQVF